MSLILDALKKAEHQRRLGQVPGIGSSQLFQPREQRAPWLWLSIAVAGLVLFVLGGLFASRLFQAEPEPVMTDQNDIQGKAEQPVVVAPAVRAVPTKPSNSQAPMLEQPAEVEPQPMVQQNRVAELPPETPVVEITEPDDQVKSIAQLPDGLAGRLPTMNIDIHSYDLNPAKRYVLINMTKYREGQYLSEGPRLVEIRADGVVLDYMGERFIKPIGN